VRENKSGPNRRATDRSKAEAETLPNVVDDLGKSRAAFEELRKYPFFFADEDDDEPTNAPLSRAAHAELERSATAPPIPAPPTEIRPLLAQPLVGAARAEATSRGAAPVPESAAPVAVASLAERHAAAIARKQSAPSAPPAPPAASVPSAAPIESAAERETIAHAAQVPQPVQEPWYSRVPTGVSLVAVIVYFLIGGVALIGTGLVLGGLGGSLMAIFGLAVTSVAALVAWQELTSIRS